MADTRDKLIIFLLEIYIIASFFVVHNTTLESFYLLFILCIFIFTHRKITLPKGGLFWLITAIVCVCFSIFFSRYNQLYTVGTFVCLYLLNLLFANKTFNVLNSIKIDVFYYLLLALLALALYRSYKSGETHVTTLMGDQNYTGILVFCIFLYSNKKKYISGILIAFLYFFIFSDSRSFFALLILFYLFKLEIFKRPAQYFFDRKNSVIKLFAISLVFVVLLSFVWVFTISDAGFDDYKVSFNDSSNRTRFLSILNGLQMLGNPEETFFWGYGGNLLETMGIYDREFNSHPTFMELRVVQPHNSIVNLLVRMGVVPTVCYFVLLSKLLTPLLTKENIPYFVPFFINAMFMHTLFSFQWLVFLTIILMIPEKKFKLKKYGERKEKG